MKLSRLFRSPIAVLAAVVIVSGSVFAFAANITNQSTNPVNAGQFQVDAEGYQINQINFTADDGATPDSAIATVQFTLTKQISTEPLVIFYTDGDNTSVQAKLKSETGSYINCSFVTGTNIWSCVSTTPMAQVDELNVVASSKN